MASRRARVSLRRAALASADARAAAFTVSWDPSLDRTTRSTRFVDAEPSADDDDEEEESSPETPTPPRRVGRKEERSTSLPPLAARASAAATSGKTAQGPVKVKLCVLAEEEVAEAPAETRTSTVPSSACRAWFRPTHRSRPRERERERERETKRTSWINSFNGLTE